MSGLYNDLCGIDPLAPYILKALDLHPTNVPRLRDAFMKLDAKKQSYDLAVLTRTGGPNRSGFVDEIEALHKHPNFIRYEDYAPLDSTYAIFVFSIPEAHTALFADAIKRDLVGPEPGERWKSMMAALHSEKDTPESRRARSFGERMFGSLKESMKDSR